MPTDVDLLILGGGCAGLSLAMQLAQHQQRVPRTLILEQRSHYDDDRTWCFWGDDRTPFADLAGHQWRAVSVRNEDRVARLDCSAAPYRMLASEAFYSAACAAISDAPQLLLEMNSPLLSEAVFKGDFWHVETPSGSVSAAMVVDTRPLTPTAIDAVLWQSFYGHEIECEQAVFEPDCVELMHFSNADSELVAFTYVLPLSRTRALVEFTVFAVQPLSAAALEDALNDAIEKRVKGAAFTLLRSEHGVLPMGLAATPAAAVALDSSSSYCRAGLFAGAARPATGYAFQRIQRWAADCAAVLAGGGAPIGHRHDPCFLAWMDRLFLHVIQRQPSLAPQLFVDMFDRVEPQRLIRFLSDRGRFIDYLSIALALPFQPFVQQLIRWRS
jgi:lycopene beta-cyclase